MITMMPPIDITVFLLVSAFHTTQSWRRIKLHEKCEMGIDVALYRGPALVGAFDEEYKQTLESINNSGCQECLGLGGEEDVEYPGPQVLGTISLKKLIFHSSQR